MNKAIKVSIIFVIILLALSMAGGLFISRLITPDQLKGRITTLVKEHTGRDLALTGDVSLSIFPWLGITIGSLALSNPPGFDAVPFLSLTEAQIRVKLLPLLSKKVDVDVITLRGLSVALVRNKDGRTNWEDLLKTSAAPSSPSTESPPAERSALLALAGVDIQDASVTWTDHRSGKQITVKNLLLTTSAVDQKTPTSVKIAFDLEQTDGTTASIESACRILPGFTANRYALDELEVKALFKGNAFPKDGMMINGTGQIRFDGMTATPGVPSREKGDNITCTFDLHADELDLDQYLKTSQAPTDAEPKAAPPATAGSKPKVETNAAGIPLPLRAGLSIDGKLSVGKLKIANLHFSDVDIKPMVQAGKVTAPIAASLYGGNLSGLLSLEARNDVPYFAIAGKLSKVAVERLLLDLQGKSPVTGTANADWTLTGAGRTRDALLRTLDGPFAFNLKDGSVTGMDAEKICRTLAAAAGGSRNTEDRIGSALSLLARPKPTTKTSDRTKFSEMGGSLVFTKGVGATKDLSLESPLMRLHGSGRIDLVNKRLDFETTAAIAKSCEGQGKKTDEAPYTVPVAIRGPLNDPDIEVDITSVLREVLSQGQSKETRGQNASKRPEDAVKRVLQDILK